MAIDPATAKLLAQMALKLATDEEARKKLLIIILTPLLCVVLILTAFVYILNHPLEFLGEFFDSQAITEVERLKNNYGTYQYLAATDYESGVTSYEGVTFTENNRNKLIELFIYVLIVVTGIILLFTTCMMWKET